MGFWVAFVAVGAQLAELVGGTRGLLLLLDVDDAARRGEEDGGAARPVGKIVVRVCHDSKQAHLVSH